MWPIGIHPPSPRCVSCDRPAAPFDWQCPYCGEALRREPWKNAGAAAVFACGFAGAAAFVLARGLHASFHATPVAMLCLGVGTGLSLLPPTITGVCCPERRSRLWQVALRYAGGVLLSLLAASALCSACAPTPWRAAHGALAAIAGLGMLAAPIFLGLPWHKLAAAGLLAAGMRMG